MARTAAISIPLGVPLRVALWRLGREPASAGAHQPPHCCVDVKLAHITVMRALPEGYTITSHALTGKLWHCSSPGTVRTCSDLFCRSQCVYGLPLRSVICAWNVLNCAQDNSGRSGRAFYEDRSRRGGGSSQASSRDSTRHGGRRERRAHCNDAKPSSMHQAICRPCPWLGGGMFPTIWPSRMCDRSPTFIPARLYRQTASLTVTRSCAPRLRVPTTHMLPVRSLC